MFEPLYMLPPVDVEQLPLSAPEWLAASLIAVLLYLWVRG